jgi:hypothetical protein
VPSNSPARIRCARVLSSIANTRSSVRTAGVPPKYCGLASSRIDVPRRHSTSRYGPVPTGCVENAEDSSGAGVATASAGTMPSVNRWGNAASGWASRKRTVCRSSASTPASVTQSERIEDAYVGSSRAA